MRGRSRALAVVLLAASAIVSGCAGVPDSGGVHLGEPVAAAGQSLVGGAIREVPALPQPAATPVQLIAGFLGAMVDSDSGYAVARSYLAHGTVWNATTGITVYANPPAITRVGRHEVTVRARQLGRIATNGTYRVETGTIDRHFSLSRRTGEWRIAGLDAGALLSADDAGRVLQPASIYFLTPSGRRVVPEPVLTSPAEPGLATTLMRGLLAGPDPMLAPGVRTAAPRGTLLVGNVPISADGVAEVDLTAGARQITPAQLMQLSAQIVWTLRQIPAVTAVRLLANGAPLASSDAPSLQSIGAWSQFDPSVPPTTPGALLVRDGDVTGFEAVVPAALRAAGLLAPARSADGAIVAALRRTRSGEQLLVGGTEGPLRVRLRAPALTAPAFGPDGRVLIATAPGTVHSVGLTGRLRRLSLPAALKGRRISSLAVSRDGTRLALILGAGELWVATIVEQHGAISVTEPRIVLPATFRVAGVAWSDADRLVATVADRDHTRHVVEVGVDGYAMSDLTGPGLPSDVDEVAAAPGQPVLASGPTGTWRLGGRRWERVSPGVSPSYAG